MSDTRAVTPESIAVKRRGRHRLIGAITLAVLAVVIIPMVLDSQPRKVGKELALNIPPKEGLPPLSAPALIPEVVKPAPDAPPPALQQSTPVSPTVAVPTPAKTVDKAPSKPTEKIPEKAAAKAEEFIIQLGAFSDPDKLATLKSKMKSAKVPVFTEDVKTADGKLTRLRAGPFKTREQADKALLQVKKAGVLDGKVIPLP